jgi:hypothetical protein
VNDKPGGPENFGKGHWFDFHEWIARIVHRPTYRKHVPAEARWLVSIPRTRWTRSYGLLLVRGKRRGT